MNRDDKPNQTWVFDRYVNGVLMAEGVEVTRASSIEKAMATAAKLAARGPNGETPVLVSRTAPAEALAEVQRLRHERDELRAAVEGLIAVLDRNGEKGPIPDVEMMFCWLAAQNVRAAFRNT